MCGISGLIELEPGRRQDLAATAASMAARLCHRGPDDGGSWSDPDFPIAFGFRRLAIIDVSPAGSQPMSSADGRYTLVFNGEIYNYRSLRSRLPGERWRGHSDTEVLLAALVKWGVRGALRQVDGMFALALWDRIERRLTLARDRFGEKPLYYGWQGSTLLFGSELKALHAHPDFRPELDRGALALFLRHDYIAAPWSIYQGVSKLPPGCYLEINAEAPASTEPQEYWSARAVAEAALANPFRGTAAQAADEVERCLASSVQSRMVSDVPIGAFLSGGLDSSTIVALMQASTSVPVRTFTIAFPESPYDEAPWAAKVARHLGTEHTELALTPRDVLDVVPRLPKMYDEPFADASQVPTHLVSALARQSVKVALTGDAGDELFAGYNRYTSLEAVWGKLRRIPRAVRPGVARLLTSRSVSDWDRLARPLQPVLPGVLRTSHTGDKVHKLASTLLRESAEEVYLDLVSRWRNPEVLLKGVAERPTPLSDRKRWLRDESLVNRMMYLDTVTYLPDDILAKVDRAAMAASLETRVPMLDPQLFELAWRLPASYKMRAGHGKRVLRDVLSRHVPDSLVERPKMGFTMPLAEWLRGDLREWAGDMLAPERLRRQEILQPEPIAVLWAQHQAGTHNWQDHLWGPIMFQAWLDHWEVRPQP